MAEAEFILLMPPLSGKFTGSGCYTIDMHTVSSLFFYFFILKKTAEQNHQKKKKKKKFKASTAQEEISCWCGVLLINAD